MLPGDVWVPANETEAEFYETLITLIHAEAAEDIPREKIAAFCMVGALSALHSGTQDGAWQEQGNTTSDAEESLTMRVCPLCEEGIEGVDMGMGGELRVRHDTGIDDCWTDTETHPGLEARWREEHQS